MNTTSLTKMQRELVAVTEERDLLAAELQKMREQKPVAYVKYKATGGNVGLSWLAVPTGAFYPREGERLYAAPVATPAVPAAPAPSVPEEWRKVMARLLDTFERCEAGFHPHVELRFAVRDEARALLQSTEVRHD